MRLSIGGGGRSRKREVGPDLELWAGKEDRAGSPWQHTESLRVPESSEKLEAGRIVSAAEFLCVILGALGQVP